MGTGLLNRLDVGQRPLLRHVGVRENQSIIQTLAVRGDDALEDVAVAASGDLGHELGQHDALWETLPAVATMMQNQLDAGDEDPVVLSALQVVQTLVNGVQFLAGSLFSQAGQANGTANVRACLASKPLEPSSN